jgi:hypothetical protein
MGLNLVMFGRLHRDGRPVPQCFPFERDPVIHGCDGDVCKRNSAASDYDRIFSAIPNFEPDSDLISTVVCVRKPLACNEDDRWPAMVGTVRKAQRYYSNDKARDSQSG